MTPQDRSPLPGYMCHHPRPFRYVVRATAVRVDTGRVEGALGVARGQVLSKEPSPTGRGGGGALLTPPPPPNCSMHGSSRGGCKQVGASIFSTAFASRTPTIHTTGEGEKTRPTMTFLITCSIHRVPLPRDGQA